MHRRNWLTAFLGLLGSALVVVWTPAFAQEGKPITLEDRLKAGLRCRRPEEFEFVALVIKYVDEGKLSKELVLGTQQWAVKQRPDAPFYYFQYGLRRRAAAIGVDI
jgi:hypothetical protein